MEKYEKRDVALIIVLLALGLFFAGLAGYFMERSPGHSALMLVSLTASTISIVGALLLVLKFLIVAPIIREIARNSEKTNRIILVSSAATSTKSPEKFLDDFNMVSKALKEMEV